MEAYDLDGKRYYYDKGRWFTSSYMIAPVELTSRLNMLLMEKDDISKKSMNELMKILDGANHGGNTQYAIKVAEKALDIAEEVSEIRGVLPRLTSLYRQVGKPQKAIDIAKEYTDLFNRKVWSQAFLTSIAAAYCDLEDYVTAKKFADIAYATYGGSSSPELMNVYERVKREGG